MGVVGVVGLQGKSGEAQRVKEGILRLRTHIGKRHKKEDKTRYTLRVITQKKQAGLAVPRETSVGCECTISLPD